MRRLALFERARRGRFLWFSRGATSLYVPGLDVSKSPALLQEYGSLVLHVEGELLYSRCFHRSDGGGIAVVYLHGGLVGSVTFYQGLGGVKANLVLTRSPTK